MNRNYGFHFGQDSDDSDPCTETYRGPSAFSEPETRAVKYFVESQTNIVSAMNFHSFGNIWIHPFNYMRTKSGYPDHLDPEVVNFYERFKKRVYVISKNSTHGNAYQTVGYSTDGEGSDWMLGERGIIAFSPELGSSDARMQEFIFDKSLIFDAINENYGVVADFLKVNTFQFQDPAFGVDSKGLLWFCFENPGLAELYDPEFVIESSTADLSENVQSINVEVRPGEIVKAKLEPISRYEAKFTVPKLRKLSSTTVRFSFQNARLLSTNLEITVRLKMATGLQVGQLSIKISNYSYMNLVMVTLGFIYLLVLVLSTLLVTRRFWGKNAQQQQ